MESLKIDKDFILSSCKGEFVTHLVVALFFTIIISYDFISVNFFYFLLIIQGILLYNLFLDVLRVKNLRFIIDKDKYSIHYNTKILGKGNKSIDVSDIEKVDVFDNGLDGYYLVLEYKIVNRTFMDKLRDRFYNKVRFFLIDDDLVSKLKSAGVDYYLIKYVEMRGKGD